MNKAILAILVFGLLSLRVGDGHAESSRRHSGAKCQPATEEMEI